MCGYIGGSFNLKAGWVGLRALAPVASGVVYLQWSPNAVGNTVMTYSRAHTAP